MRDPVSDLLPRDVRLRPFRIGGVRVDPPLLLAPMAELSHAALRGIVAGFGGCGLFLSEMLSCRAVVHEDPATDFRLRRTPADRPFFYQLVGNDPGDMARAVRHLEAACDGPPPDGFDINMGCSAPLIRNRGLGSGLLRDPETARRVVAACRAATRRALTVKIRLCWEEAAEATIRLAEALVSEGVDAVTLHPRLPAEKFRRRARWSAVAELKRALSVPVIGNGDIETPADVLRRMAETGCDGIMIGRAAVQKPWIFRATADPGFRETVDLARLFRDFLDRIEQELPPEYRPGRLKTFVPYFAKNFAFGHQLATAVRNASSLAEAREEAESFFARNAGACRVPVEGRGASATCRKRLRPPSRSGGT